MPLAGAPPTGRGERLGLAATAPGNRQAERLSSRIVQAGHRHAIGAELAGNWHGRPALVFDLDLASDYGAGGNVLPGVVSGRFHVAAIGLRRHFPWCAVTRPDIREHLDGVGKATRLPGTPRLEGIRLLADPPAAQPLPTAALEWAGRDAITRRAGRHQISVIELAGPWALAAVAVASMEHSDENAAALAGKLGRPELAPWPERLLTVLEELAALVEEAPH